MTSTNPSGSSSKANYLFDNGNEREHASQNQFHSCNATENVVPVSEVIGRNIHRGIRPATKELPRSLLFRDSIERSGENPQSSWEDIDDSDDSKPTIDKITIDNVVRNHVDQFYGSRYSLLNTNTSAMVDYFITDDSSDISIYHDANTNLSFSDGDSRSQLLNRLRERAERIENSEESDMEEYDDTGYRVLVQGNVEGPIPALGDQRDPRFVFKTAEELRAEGRARPWGEKMKREGRLRSALRKARAVSCGMWSRTQKSYLEKL